MSDSCSSTTLCSSTCPSSTISALGSKCGHGRAARVRAEIRRRASDLLDLVQLPGVEHRFPAQLSGGQRQRVALARALAIEPAVLLLDEPFGALDAKVRRELRRWLRELHDRTGHTTVFVTHDQEEALELADRVVVMSQGRVEQVGSADDVYDRPASPFVFSFMGELSVLPVTIANRTVWLDDRPLALETNDAPDGAVELFVRPQDVEVVSDSPGTISAVITASRRTGSARRIEVAVGAAGHRIEVEVPAEFIREPRGRVNLCIRRCQLYSGNRSIAAAHFAPSRRSLAG